MLLFLIDSSLILLQLGLLYEVNQVTFLSVYGFSGLILETTTLLLVCFLHEFLFVLEFVDHGATRLIFLLINISLFRQVSNFVLLLAHALNYELLQPL